MKQPFAMILVLCLLNACAPAQSPPNNDTHNQPIDSPPMNTPADSDSLPGYAPHPNDDQLARGKVYMDSVEIITMESYPLRFSVTLKGNLPTPCHELRINKTGPDSENKINLEAYSVADPNKVCTQVLQPFEANFNLGSFASGHYLLFVNGEKRGEFDA